MFLLPQYVSLSQTPSLLLPSLTSSSFSFPLSKIDRGLKNKQTYSGATQGASYFIHLTGKKERLEW